MAVRTRGTRGEEGAGDAAFALLSLAACGVLTFRQAPPGYRIRRILVTTDFSEAAGRGVEWGGAIAEITGAELHLLHVVAAEPENRRRPSAALSRAAAELERWQRRINLILTRPVRRATVIRASRPAAGIVATAVKERCDLVVLAATGASNRRAYPPGSTARDVALESPCPVLIIPPDLRSSVTDFLRRAWSFSDEEHCPNWESVLPVPPPGRPLCAPGGLSREPLP